MSNAWLLAYHYGHGSWLDWIMHVTVSSVIHALVFRLVGRVMHQMTLAEAVVLVAVVLGCLFMWAQSRDRRR